ncbi:hypothetical protein [Nocardioides convexus]|uniref:hypothetical protein n=1 Tax=Nocardioides convexus TaxID=2712224 RepID=UPI0024187627|nr:hypothetical protein [Nocardioides convexus]
MTGNPDQPPNDATPESATARLEREWAVVVGDLQAHQRAWLQSSKPVTLHGTTAIVAVPDDFTRKRLEGRLRGQLEDVLTERFGHEVQARRHRRQARCRPSPASRGTRTTTPRPSRRSTCRQVARSTHRRTTPRGPAPPPSTPGTTPRTARRCCRARAPRPPPAGSRG